MSRERIRNGFALRWLLLFACLLLLRGEKSLAEPTGQTAEVPGQGFAMIECAGRLFAVGLDEGGLATAFRASRPDGDSTLAWTRSELNSVEALNFAARAESGEQYILIGGVDSSGRRSKIVQRLSASGDALQSERLPDFPVAISHASASLVGSTLYVVGGLIEDGEISNRLFALSLDSPRAQWRELAPIPAPGRIAAIATSSFKSLHVIGGRTRETAPDGTIVYRASDEVWTYRPTPVDGTNVRGWTRGASLPYALSHASAFQSGQSHTLVLGGDTRAESSETDAPQTTVAGVALAYHFVTDTWTPLETLRSTHAARSVGGSLVNTRDGIVHVGQSIESIRLPKPGSSLAWLDYVAIGVYFAGIAAIGLYFAKRQTTSDEFSLGNRKVPWWAGAMSMYATGVSSISLMAIPVLGFTANLVFLLPVFFMLPQALIQARFIVPLLRKLEITSTYEYLERRYSTPLRLLASAQCIGLQTFGRMSIVLLLPSIALSATTGLNVYASILLMGVLTTIYTSTGGFEAVIWTDVVQGLVMFIGPIVIIFYALSGVPGGMSEVVSVGADYGKFLAVLWTWDWTVMAIWIAVLAAILNVAGFAGDQPIVQRVYATPLRDVKRLQYTFACLGVSIAVLVTLVGLSLFFFYRANPSMLDPTMSNDQLVPRFIVDVLPMGVAGILVAAIFAAAMSTLSSSMNSVSVLVSEDFYRRFSKSTDDRRRLRLMKSVSYLAGAIGMIIALWMATFEVRSMIETWNRIAALLGGGFVGIYALGIFTKRTNATGAICGAVASVFWTLFAERFTPMHWSLLAPSATLACIVVGYLTSLLTGPAKRDLSGLTIYTVRAERSDPTPANA